ncbi:hypothetical protein CC78DRAFT_621278 [Lojkania enalia]|uniref:Uncharacterized protein n=1 Tax=Lojkania enalia TaxID=147567 RepID=A0A9P4JZ33_9PLEO|nr:hypothetical protein CC78DRAFT_621278 [Didymosphaeria enalia]
MDKASPAHGDVPLSTLHHRARGRRSREAKAQSQLYLTPCEENAVVDFLLQMDNLGQPIRIIPLKPPGVNWAKRLGRRRLELVAIKEKPQDWNGLNIYDKVSHWFEVIGKELRSPVVQLDPRSHGVTAHHKQ